MQENVFGEIVSKEATFWIVESKESKKFFFILDAIVRNAFAQTIESVKVGDRISFLECEWVDENKFSAKLIVFEPDFLIDASALAECFKDYGSNPLYFILNRLEPKPNNKYFLLGNAANLFLDECIHAEDLRNVQYADVIQKVFRSAPFELATCPDLNDKETERAFFISTKKQLQNIKDNINTEFSRLTLNREKLLIEPSFVAPKVGLQGRLDVLQQDSPTTIVELKSGKSPFPETDASLIGINHQTQAFVYQTMMHFVFGVPYRNVHAYILYSRYEAANHSLRLVPFEKSYLQKMIDLRNAIVINELRIASSDSLAEVKNLIFSIDPDHLLVGEAANTKFVHKYIFPQLKQFLKPLQLISDLELQYFLRYYVFLTREQACAKIGSQSVEGLQCAASVWRSSSQEKLNTGDLLIDLQLINNNCSDEKPMVEFAFSTRQSDYLPNFRVGDIVVLYERISAEDNVTNHQIYRGSIAELNEKSIVIRLRSRQRNPSLFKDATLYAVEHDYMEASFTAMFRSLYTFVLANQERRDLLLMQRKPCSNSSINLVGDYQNEAINSVVLQAKQAQDLYLLVGPPGTGKTSIALKAMVEEFYHSSEVQNILLLSYTNRAVDEICQSLSHCKGLDYIRVGSSLACDDAYQSHLLDNRIAGCQSRQDVREVLQAQRIFVGTVASISGKMDLFRLKHFDVAIVDEASQILEPYLLNLFSVKDLDNKNGIDKFIFIGDQKQLPAVVLQSEIETQVSEMELIEIGLTNSRNSLFERFFNAYKNDTSIVGMLRKQGRMHPDIAAFTNDYFYGAKVQPIPLAHQCGALAYRLSENATDLQRLLSHKRIAFFDNENCNPLNFKYNRGEASIISNLVKALHGLFQSSEMEWNKGALVGIIAPYRSQIATIRQSLRLLNFETEKIVIDTVERFQGSQRDIIIYSFCVNKVEQLALLSNYTEVDHVMVDRKLNVALTRARKQLLLVGNQSLLRNNAIYSRLLDSLK